MTNEFKIAAKAAYDAAVKSVNANYAFMEAKKNKKEAEAAALKAQNEFHKISIEENGKK